MNIDKLFPSNYLKASDLEGRAVRVTMGKIEVHKLGEDERPVLSIQGAEKGLVLNKTNAMTIASLYGEDTDDWFGKEIELYSTKVNFQGKMTDAIRVKAVAQAAGEGEPVPF